MSDSQDLKSDLLIEPSRIVIKDSAGQVVRRLMQVTKTSSETGLSKFFGLSPTVMTNRRARGVVPYEEAHMVALAWGVDLNWLLLGSGAAPDMDATVASLKDMPAPYPRIDADDDEYLRVPLYDIEIAAGDGTFWDGENVEKYLKYRREDIRAAGYNENALVAFRSRGDSMTGTINDRDIILADRSQTEPDGVFVIRVGDRLRVKRLQRLTSGSLRVSSDNTMYAPETIDGADLEQVEIIGQCCERCGRIY